MVEDEYAYVVVRRVDLLRLLEEVRALKRLVLDGSRRSAEPQWLVRSVRSSR